MFIKVYIYDHYVPFNIDIADQVKLWMSYIHSDIHSVLTIPIVPFLNVISMINHVASVKMLLTGHITQDPRPGIYDSLKIYKPKELHLYLNTTVTMFIPISKFSFPDIWPPNRADLPRRAGWQRRRVKPGGSQKYRSCSF